MMMRFQAKIKSGQLLHVTLRNDTVEFGSKALRPWPYHSKLFGPFQSYKLLDSHYYNECFAVQTQEQAIALANKMELNQNSLV